MAETLRFNYRLPRTQMLLMVLGAIAVPIALAFIAARNARGLRLLGLLNLSPRGASTFYWVLAGLALLAAAVAIRVAVQSMHTAGYVELGTTGALLPAASLSQAMFGVPYASIRNIRRLDLPGQQMLVVSSRLGEARLLSKSFASPAEFEAFVRALQERAHG